MEISTIKNPAIRLREPVHRVLSILAARSGKKLKDLVEEILTDDPAMQLQAKAEGIKLKENHHAE